VLFHSREFLLLFLPAFLVPYLLLRGTRLSNVFLLVASYVFYAGWDYRYCGLILLSTTIDWFAARWIAKSANPAVRRTLLIASITASLSILGFFKYAGFGVEVANALFGGWLHGHVPAIDVLLPVGISFYTFQSMSYTIDVYRGTVRPAERFVDFACFISMFPQLVAGPIVRYAQVESALKARRIDADDVTFGVHRFAVGLCKKAILGDSLAEIADPIFASTNPGFAAAWVGALAFTLQIYFDFAGYSDMAIGLGRLLGFRFPANFDAPYLAVGLRDYWRRWHITLSTWLRDYLYVPLGGSRRGRPRVYLNLVVTMLLGGLWHGAAATFVVWGAYHGLLLCVEHALQGRNPLARLPVGVRRAGTFLLILLGFVVFRSPDLSTAWAFLGAMVRPERLSAPELAPWSLGILAGAMLLAFRRSETPWTPPFTTWRAVAATAALLLIGMAFGLEGDYTPFIYFQF